MRKTIRTVGLVSLGCAKNRVDSEQLLGVLRGAGYEIVADPARADAIFVNTCGFIESAKQESIDTILEMDRYRKSGQLKLLCVTGCLSQRYPDDLFREMPEIDMMLGVGRYEDAARLLDRAREGERVLDTSKGAAFPCLPRVITTGDSACYVRIAEGCDNRCTYCAIPQIRGGYVSRDMEDILDECLGLAEKGYTEITLIAQDTSRYGEDLYGRRALPELLKKAAAIPGVRWVRVLYCYPDSADDELLDAIAGTPHVVPYLDLPLQHINARLLKAMNRRGSPELIRSRIEGCRRRGIAVRTTFIVGFPGETEQEFEELLDFVREAKFERMGAFTYSPEDGTAAAGMPGQIPEDVKRDRLDRLMLAQQEISRAYNLSRVGSVEDVLIESEEGGVYRGRTAMEAPEGSDGDVLVSAKGTIPFGTYVTCRITGASEYDITAEVL